MPHQYPQSVYNFRIPHGGLLHLLSSNLLKLHHPPLDGPTLSKAQRLGSFGWKANFCCPEFRRADGGFYISADQISGFHHSNLKRTNVSIQPKAAWTYPLLGRQFDISPLPPGVTEQYSLSESENYSIPLCPNILEYSQISAIHRPSHFYHFSDPPASSASTSFKDSQLNSNIDFEFNFDLELGFDAGTLSGAFDLSFCHHSIWFDAAPQLQFDNISPNFSSAQKLDNTPQPESWSEDVSTSSNSIVDTPQTPSQDSTSPVPSDISSTITTIEIECTWRDCSKSFSSVTAYNYVYQLYTSNVY